MKVGAGKYDGKEEEFGKLAASEDLQVAGMEHGQMKEMADGAQLQSWELAQRPQRARSRSARYFDGMPLTATVLHACNARSRHAGGCCDQAPWSEWTTTRARAGQGRPGSAAACAMRVALSLRSNQGTGAGPGAGPVPTSGSSAGCTDYRTRYTTHK